MSGGEPSSIKRIFPCAAGLLILSWLRSFGCIACSNVGVRSYYEPVAIFQITKGERPVATYQALYRKYRPQTFDDVVGQMAVTQTIKTQLVSGHLSHAYLFTGSRGTGKTSCAKILAKAVNCLNPQNGNPCNVCEACRAIDSGACMDVLEIDAASNNGVDNVRDLRDDAIYTPSQVKMRVYIIDEVHMLSISAFNALLKIIEEPPEHLLFILATTELHKVPATILSRCQRFSFRRISQDDIAARLQYVAYQENIDLDDAAAKVLARLADGGMRDGLSLLDQCASATVGELSAQRVYECLGIAGERVCGRLLGYVAAHDTKNALELFNRLYADGKDIGALLDELACLCRDLLILKTAPEAAISMISGVASDSEVATLRNQFSSGELVRMMNVIQQTAAGFTRSASRRMDAELCLIDLCQPELQINAEALNARLTRLEEQIKTGVVVASSVESPKVLKQETDDYDDDRPPMPGDEDAPPAENEVTPVDDTPIGFWMDVAAAVRQELRPPVTGFFAPTPNAPVQGLLRGNELILQCANPFTLEMVNKPEIIALVERKASAKLGRPVRVKAADKNSTATKSKQMEQLLSFGRAHGDIVKIKED